MRPGCQSCSSRAAALNGITEVQALSEGRMTGIDTWNVRTMRIRALGGTTGHWAGWCRPLTPQDFEARDYIPLSGWPIKYSDLVPFYRRACETVQIGEFDWNSAARAKATGKALLPLGAAIDQRYYQFSPPTRFGSFYSDVLGQAEDVRVLTFANVRDIRLDQRRGRVESFACRTLQGTTFNVHAGRYVLALGGIENARVLLASRSQESDGVANGHGVVGRYFMEHPHYYGSVGVVHPSTVDLSFYKRGPSDLKRADGTAVETLGALGLAAEISRREKLLNFSATFAGSGCRTRRFGQGAERRSPREHRAGAGDARRRRLQCHRVDREVGAVAVSGQPHHVDGGSRCAGDAEGGARLADRSRG